MNWRKCTKNYTIVSIVYFLVIFCLLFSFTEQGPLFGNGPTQLYGPEDQVYILNATTIKERVYGSSRGWVVEFFSSWCGHCIHFAPKWKQFAADLAPWQNIVVIAGIDCADDNNVAICREYEIMGYPSLRFFPPHSPKTKKIKDKDTEDYKDDLYRGEDVEKSDSVMDMKRSVIDLTIPFVHNFYAPTSLEASKISDSASLWELVKTKDKTTAVAPMIFFVFETENSYLAKELALTLSKFPSVVIFRFTKKNSIYTELKLSGWPAAGYVKRDNTAGSIVFNKNQSILNNLLQMIANIAHLPIDDFSSTSSSIRENIISEVKLEKEDAISNNLEEPSTSSGVISMEDLLHAVRNLLKNEVGLLKEISGSKLVALKNFVHTLAEYFPADRRETLLFLMKLSAWLSPMEQIDDTTYMDKLTELEMELHPWDIDFNSWGNCRGSMPGRRGYTCSLWSLFHTLTVACLEKNQQFPVLDAIYGYVKEFFGCKECSGHFSRMIADDGALMINPIKDQVLWLWKAHNKVNQRLKGTLSEDPVFPKIQYPSETQCPECYGKEENNIFDEEKVLHYLLSVYSKPERTMQPMKSYPERIYSSNNGKQKYPQAGFFSGTDYWLMCIVYLCVASLLIFGYVHFRVRKGARLDISYLLCWKLKHHYVTGKNNV